MAEVRAPELRSVRDRLGLSRELMSRVLEVSTRSVERWESRGSASVSADTQRRVATVSEIAELAREVYGDDVSAFMSAPRRSLGMRTPREAMVHGDLEGVRQILINALEGHWA
jgi:uncharacterized protein (DUF2384 family)